MTRRTLIGGVGLVLVLGALAAIWLPRACTAQPQRVMIPRGGDSGLTFFVWSDQHVKRDGNAHHLNAPVEAMNSLPGTEYPQFVGGKVARPEFVLGCGDCTDWPSAEARDAFAKAIGRLKFVSVNILGNHDEDDEATDRIMVKWTEARHGDVNFSFDCGGVHFAAIRSGYNPKQQIATDAIDWLEADLAKVPPGRPVVIANHYCLEAISNKDEFVSAFGKANVILVLGGHYHRATTRAYKSRNFIQVPSPTVKSQFWVIRISVDRLQAVLYDYAANQWLDAPRFDIPFGPAFRKDAGGLN